MTFVFPGRKLTRRVCVVLCGLLAFSVSFAPLAGCGGGGDDSGVSNSPATGRATAEASVTWPDRANPGDPATRPVPLLANSIRLVVRAGNGDGIELAGRTITRPATATTASASFTDLPTGRVTIVASAYQSGDGTGVPLATQNLFLDLTANQTSSTTVALRSTITRVEFTPNPIPAGATSVLLTAVAFDAQNRVVPSESWQWSSNNLSVLTVAPNGRTAQLNVIGAGNALLEVKELESGATLTLEIRGASGTPPAS